MSVGNKWMGAISDRIALAAQANKGKRINGPTFPPPKELPPRPKTARKDNTND